MTYIHNPYQPLPPTNLYPSNIPPTHLYPSNIPPTNIYPTNLHPNMFPPTNVMPIQTSVLPTSTIGEAFKPVKAGKRKAHIIFILDDSVSMSGVTDGTISGFNEFLNSQKLDQEKTGIQTFISLYKFGGSSVDQVYNKAPVEFVKNLDRTTYIPGRHSTNLRDAFGSVMINTNNDLEKNAKKDRESVMIVLLTDGHENSSRTFWEQDLKLMVSKCEEVNWGFSFLGANMDAFAVGNQYGFRQENTLQYNTSNMSGTIAAASEMTNRFKSSRSLGLNAIESYEASAFTFEERTNAVKND